MFVSGLEKQKNTRRGRSRVKQLACALTMPARRLCFSMVCRCLPGIWGGCSFQYPP